MIFAQVMGKSAVGLLLKVLCNSSDCPRVVNELGVKVYLCNITKMDIIFRQSCTH